MGSLERPERELPLLSHYTVLVQRSAKHNNELLLALNERDYNKYKYKYAKSIHFFLGFLASLLGWCRVGAASRERGPGRLVGEGEAAAITAGEALAGSKVPSALKKLVQIL